MNYLCRLRGLVIFIVLFLFTSNIVVYANGAPADTSPVAMTGNILLVEKENITIEREDLFIDIKGDYVNVKVIYNLLNNGEKNNFKYAFPVDYFVDEHSSYSSEILSSFSIFDGEKKLNVKEELIEEKNVDKQQNFSGYANMSIEKILRKWFVTKINFKANEKKTITVQYKVKSSYCDLGVSNQFLSIYDKNFFIYDLTPAANFGDGIIKNFNVTIDVKNLKEIGGKIEKMNLKNCKYSDGVYKFTRNDFNIDKQKNILLRYDCTDSKAIKEMMDTRINNDHIKRIVASSTLKGYDPKNLLDVNLDTTWAEGAKGLGIYQWIKVEFCRPIRLGLVGIANGYTKSEETYNDNGKIKKLRIERFCNNHLVGEAIVELKDRSFKEISKKDSNKSIDVIKDYGDGYEKVDKIRITVLDIYEGNKCEDTCISELFLLSHDDFKDETLLKLYNKKEKSSEDISKILDLLPYVNANDFYQISGIGFDDVIGWIDTLELNKDSDYINVLKLSHSVDGAASEMYSGITKKLFLKDSARFIKQLSKVRMNMESISSLLAYELQFDQNYDAVYEKIDALLKSNTLSKPQNETARLFLKSFRRYVEEISL